MSRIVIDARSVSGRKSGIGNYTEALIRHLVPLAPDFEFVILRHPQAQQPIVSSPRLREIAFTGETKSVHTLLMGRAHQGFEHCDLYHSPGDLIPLGLRCPWVVTVHDLMWIEAPKLASSFLPVRIANGLWYRFNYGHSVRGARAVIAISQTTADAISRVYPQHAFKTHVVHHGLDRQRYDAASAGPRSLLDSLVPPDCRYSLIVGQGSPYKNHIRMIEAFLEATRDDPSHRLVLVRRFSRVDIAMNRLLADARVKRKVVVLRHIPDETLLALYRHARMLLFVSLYEGFGLPALEAMAMGTAVLGSTFPAVREVTADAALLANPTDHNDIVGKIQLLDRDEALRAELIGRGKKRAAEFTWERCAAKTLEVYREAMKQR